MVNRNFIFTGLLLISAITATGQSVSEKRTFTRSMPASKGTKLEVRNKYGDVHVTSWNRDSVYIMAEVEAFAPSRSKLNKMFDGIRIDIEEAGPILTAETEFDQNIAMLLESFKDLTEKIIDYNSKVKISYFINAPVNIDIKIDNQFGDVLMENNTGEMSVKLSNGSFKANRLNSLQDLTMTFGKAEITAVSDAKMNVTFSEVIIDEVSNLTINSTSTKFNLKKAGRLNVESRRDKFFLGTVEELTGTSYFTDYKAEQLEKGADITVKYGSLDIFSVPARFEKIDIRSTFTDITIEFEPSASYAFEIRNTNSFVAIPERNSRSGKEEINGDRKEYLLTGTVGNNQGTRMVRIEATRGNIYLK
ncbi:MAG: hypothetical protein WCE64_01045 [Bacteroidales bacterium]